jgi:phosphoenolpyruvate carboxykinase (GTP)
MELILHPKVQEFIDKSLKLLTPKDIVYVIDDSIKERLISTLVEKKTLIPLKKREGSYLARSDPKDVARVEDKTFICSKNPINAGPTNNYADPKEMKKKLNTLFKKSMKGKTAYIVFFAMGHLESPMCQLGIQITDSAYVVLNSLIMTRLSRAVFDTINTSGEFIACLHSTSSKGKMPSWPCDPENTVIAHFPETREVFSYGSGYGGNALVGKKCIALRLASVIGRKKGFLAEHMLIIKVTSPEGQSKGLTAAFPSSCGKTNLALLQSTLPDWKVEVVGDDIAWILPTPDGFFAINPEMGMFGVAPGTSVKTNPTAMETISKNTIFTNVALTADGDVWWEGMTPEAPQGLIDWQGKPFVPGKAPAAHPNSRFTVSILQCPTLAEEFHHPKGLKIDGIIFGGRRSDTIPLVMEAGSFQMGVLFGTMLSSETTAASTGAVGKIRHDPFAMLPFCGYHMGDYFAHWIQMKKVTNKAFIPHLYQVNWFLKDENQKYIWPGFQENIRVIEWIFRRIDNKRKVDHSFVGQLPTLAEFNFEGLHLSDAAKKQLFTVDEIKWKEEIKQLQTYLQQFKPKLPEILSQILDKLLT